MHPNETAGGRYSRAAGMMANWAAGGDRPQEQEVTEYAKEPAIRRPEGRVNFQHSSLGKGGVAPPMSRTDAHAQAMRMDAVHETPYAGSNGRANYDSGRAYSKPLFRQERMLPSAMRRPEQRY